MKTITMTDEDKNNIAVGTEVIATQDGFEYSAGDVLVILEQDYDHMPAAIRKGDDDPFGCFHIDIAHFEVLDLSDVAPTTTAVKLLPGERPKHGVVYTVIGGGDGGYYLEGWEMVLLGDDGTDAPWFVRVNGRGLLQGMSRVAIRLSYLTYEPEQTTTPAPKQSDEQIKRSLPVGTRVRLLVSQGSLDGLHIGAEGCIEDQDGSDMPAIQLDRFMVPLYVETKDFEAIPVTPPAEVTQDNLAFGQVYKLTGWGCGADEGDLVVLKENDGSYCPWFTRLGDGAGVITYLDRLVAVDVVESKGSTS